MNESDFVSLALPTTSIRRATAPTDCSDSNVLRSILLSVAHAHSPSRTATTRRSHVFSPTPLCSPAPARRRNARRRARFIPVKNKIATPRPGQAGVERLHDDWQESNDLHRTPLGMVVSGSLSSHHPTPLQTKRSNGLQARQPSPRSFEPTPDASTRILPERWLLSHSAFTRLVS